MDPVITPERRHELRAMVAEGAKQYELEVAAERTLADEITTEVITTLDHYPFLHRKNTGMPVYIKSIPSTGLAVRVGVLGFDRIASSLVEPSTAWSLSFTDEAGEQTTVMMFGGKLFSLDEQEGGFVYETSKAPKLFSLWKQIQESQEVEPFTFLSGGGVERKFRPDRIKLLGHSAMAVIRHRWQRWVDANW